MSISGLQKKNSHHLHTPNQIIPNKPPATMAIGGFTPNHFDATNEDTEIRTNQGSLSIGLPSCDSSLINPILHNRYTAVNMRPTAPHSTPLSAETNIPFIRIFFQIASIAVFIRIPGIYTPRYPRTAPARG